MKDLTGVDLLSLFPPYENQQQADSIVLSYGGLPEILDSCLLPTHDPQPGDLVLLDAYGVTAVGIVVPQDLAVFKTQLSVHEIPLSACARFWSAPWVS